MRVYVSCVKRVLDFVIALIALCLLCPFFSLVVILLFIAVMFSNVSILASGVKSST